MQATPMVLAKKMVSSVNFNPAVYDAVIQIIYINQEQYWAQYGTLWNSTENRL